VVQKSDTPVFNHFHC